MQNVTLYVFAVPSEEFLLGISSSFVYAWKFSSANLKHCIFLNPMQLDYCDNFMIGYTIIQRLKSKISRLGIILYYEFIYMSVLLRVVALWKVISVAVCVHFWNAQVPVVVVPKSFNLFTVSLPGNVVRVTPTRDVFSRCVSYVYWKINE